MNRAEPWLRETDLGHDPAVNAVLFALEQAREDLERFALGREHFFQLRHIAGSLDRLTTYLQGGALSEEQLQELAREEADGGETREELLRACSQAIARAAGAVQSLDHSEFGAARYVGRKRIRTTAIGLAIHMAEHTQRHVGQTIAYSRVGVQESQAPV